MPYPFIRIVSRQELDPLVIVCSSTDVDEGEEGVPFLRNHYLWEYVKIAEGKASRIKFFALYVK